MKKIYWLLEVKYLKIIVEDKMKFGTKWKVKLAFKTILESMENEILTVN